MYLTFHGHTCVRLQEKTQAHDRTIVIDPYTISKGGPPGIGAGNVVLATRGEKNLRNISGDPFIITTPGEFEIKEVMIYGIAVNNDLTVFRFDINNIRYVHLGLIKDDIEDALLESFGDVDVLFIPVGGNDTLKPHRASAMVQKIQPRVVVPMAYKIQKLDKEHGPLTDFLKEIGKADIEKVDKFKTLKKNLPDDDMGVVVLKVST